MGHCGVYNQDQGLYAYYPMHRWVDSSQFPWHMVLVPRALTEALDYPQIVIEGGYEQGTLYSAILLMSLLCNLVIAA